MNGFFFIIIIIMETKLQKISLKFGNKHKTLIKLHTFSSMDLIPTCFLVHCTLTFSPHTKFHNRQPATGNRHPAHLILSPSISKKYLY